MTHASIKYIGLNAVSKNNRYITATKFKYICRKQHANLLLHSGLKWDTMPYRQVLGWLETILATSFMRNTISVCGRANMGNNAWSHYHSSLIFISTKLKKRSALFTELSESNMGKTCDNPRCITSDSNKKVMSHDECQKFHQNCGLCDPCTIQKRDRSN